EGDDALLQDHWYLVDTHGQKFRLPKTMLFLGREECDVVLAAQSVDKRHAVLTFDLYLNKFKVKDLSTTNGTYVNNARIPEQEYVTLQHMDSIRLGHDILELSIAEDLTALEPSPFCIPLCSCDKSGSKIARTVWRGANYGFECRRRQSPWACSMHPAPSNIVVIHRVAPPNCFRNRLRIQFRIIGCWASGHTTQRELRACQFIALNKQHKQRKKSYLASFAVQFEHTPKKAMLLKATKEMLLFLQKFKVKRKRRARKAKRNVTGASGSSDKGRNSREGQSNDDAHVITMERPEPTSAGPHIDTFSIDPGLSF
ncbi:hypothetical protein Btru_056724, partial [Bulinus truncatus]